MKNEEQNTDNPQGNGVLPCVSHSCICCGKEIKKLDGFPKDKYKDRKVLDFKSILDYTQPNKFVFTIPLNHILNYLKVLLYLDVIDNFLL